MSGDFLVELQSTFLSEASEMLAGLEVLILKFETNPADATTIQAIFRTAHTLKGSAKSASFEEFAQFAHIVENLLVKLQKEQIAPSPEVIDLLLAANDKMGQWIEGLKLNTQFTLDTRDCAADIQRICNAAPTVAPEPPPMAAQGWGVFEDTPEEKPEPPKVTKSEKPDESIRVSLRKIDGLLDLFGEQVILQASLEQVRRETPDNHELADALVNQLGKITYDLQHTAMSLRMVSLGVLFQKMRRTVRDTAKFLNKKVEVEAVGEDTELDKSVVDELSGAVAHLLKNAVDHGMETSEERIAKGKNPVATLSISASQDNGRFVLKVADDGRGLDKEKILRKAREQGLVSASGELTDEQIHALIFKSGFSTASTVTDVSGRGVGMDAVKSVVERLRGEIHLHSVAGKGTTFTIRLPLSMAIFNGMVFRLSQERYILPSREIREIISYDTHDVQRIDEGKLMILKGDKTLQVVKVGRMLQSDLVGKGLQRPQRCVALVVRKDDKEYALEVDEIIGQQRVVLKKLGRELENFPNVSGGAILGDGRVAMILNLDSIGA